MIPELPKLGVRLFNVPWLIDLMSCGWGHGLCVFPAAFICTVIKKAVRQRDSSPFTDYNFKQFTFSFILKF